MNFKSVIFLFLSFYLSISTINSNAQDCYELVWNDEFNYTGLPDSTLWTFEEGGDGWGNNELQYYTSKRLENAHVENGVLTIEARRENYNDRAYTSARLITYPNNHSWKYGKIEARIKLPYGQGIWPAFWMLGDGIFEGNNWPSCGEIDIMELVGGGEGKDDVVHGSIHYSDINNTHVYNTGQYQLSNGIFNDVFHVFSIEWTQDKIKWFMDGNQYFSKSLAGTDLTEFQKEFFILLNIAVGGNWPGNPDETTVFPQKMLVDYVRVYQLNTQPTIIGVTDVNKSQKNSNYKTVESDQFLYSWSVPEGASITNGQSSNSINVTWGCEPGTVMCQVTTTCSNYVLELPVDVQKISIAGKNKIEPNESNIRYELPELNETVFQWEVPNDVTFTSETDTNVVIVNWGNTEGYIKVNITNSCGVESDSLLVEIAAQLPYPDPETKHPIPGTIEATDYDYGGEGYAYHDSDAINEGPGVRQDEGVDTEANDGGQNVGWIKPGEWLEYTVQVDSSGLYDIVLRTASLNGGGAMKILFNGENRTNTILIPRTGAWNVFTTVEVENIQLYDTDTLMRVEFVVGEFNLSRYIFTPQTTSIAEHTNNFSNIHIYPVPANDVLKVTSTNPNLNYHIINILGETYTLGSIRKDENISITELPVGTYFINFYNEFENTTLKFIKQ